MKKEKKLDVVFILDKSGSMGGQEENTISSFNEYLEKEKKNKYETNITTVLFSDRFNVIHDRVPVSKVKKLTNIPVNTAIIMKNIGIWEALILLALLTAR